MPHNSFILNFKIFLKNRTVKCTILTILLSLALLFFVSNGIEQVDNNACLGKNISDNPSIYTSNADIIILGDSRAQQGIDSCVVENAIQKKFGKEVSVYNLGTPGMQTPFAYFIFADYLNKSIKKPKVVIVNFSFYLLGGMQWMEDIYFSYYKPELWQVLDAIDSKLINVSKAISWYFVPRIPFLRYKKRFKSGIIESIAGDVGQIYKSFCWSVFFEKQVISGRTKGYFSRGSAIVPKETLDKNSYNKYKNNIHNGYSVYIQYFKKFCDLAAQHNINVVIYQFPWPEISKDNEYFKKDILLYYENLLKNIVRGNPFIHFIEYDYFWPHDLFTDPLHLNQMGANKLSSEYISEWAIPYIYPS